MNKIKGKSGFLLLESVLELFLISIITITVLATFARTVFILKTSLIEMRDLNIAQNTFISIYTLIKDEIKTTNDYSKNHVYIKSNDSYIGIEYRPFLKKVNRKTNEGTTLITNKIDFFEFKDNYLTIELEGYTYKIYIKQEE
jgi:type II secretory pathway pseudopilin PulG